MKLNTIQPANGAKKVGRRVGRGIGSGLGKTAGRGHKGQKSRAGGYHKVGFEGGQMPLYRRLPKRGFVSLSKQFDGQVTLTDLQKLGLAEIDLVTLKKSGLVSVLIKHVKIIKTGELSMAITVRGILATAGAKAAVEAAGFAAVSSMSANIAPIKILSPSFALRNKTPACSAFTSKVAFSLSNSAITSSRSTHAPSAFVHFNKVTSVIDSPTVGTFIEIIIETN